MTPAKTPASKTVPVAKKATKTDCDFNAPVKPKTFPVIQTAASKTINTIITTPSAMGARKDRRSSMGCWDSRWMNVKKGRQMFPLWFEMDSQSRMRNQGAYGDCVSRHGTVGTVQRVAGMGVAELGSACGRLAWSERHAVRSDNGRLILSRSNLDCHPRKKEGKSV